ncbi:hypothetical protein EW146_g2697 [Bondarzewia mesenterica]|uniref:DUF6589 domain-containing protein n=1 Tax=Bondarzewia mesenterica TaxID=1095465 RepID=A0A4S4M610_9AGAM|nr:hypothetical protein EW146_g2697 [Bondarzewia mesenterica]
MLGCDKKLKNDGLADESSIKDGKTANGSKADSAGAKERNRALIQIKQVAVMSIMMQSANQQCNALGSIIGIFLHSCNTPEKVIKMLSRIGISISVSSVNNAIKSLSVDSRHTIIQLGQKLTAGFAYDNFDVNLKVSMLTVEQSEDTLVHLTSGDVLQLEHCAPEDLKCSEELWKKSPLNDEADESLPQHTYVDLLTLHPETEHASGLTRRGQFNTWRFILDLIEHGPAYFQQFRDRLHDPEIIDQIPLSKLEHTPARSMDINQSKVLGNLQAIANLLAQGGLGDPNDDDCDSEVVDISEFVTLIYGDLGTWEWVRSLLERRAIEDTPWLRYQFVVFVMGLFHLKMACADAIWQIFINPPKSRQDNNTFIKFVDKLRPKETGKITSDPGFRRMHEVIGHIGICLRLDAWRVEVEKRHPECKTLDDWAKLQPSFEDIEDIARTLVSDYVLGEGIDISDLRSNKTAACDLEHENILLMHQYLLLYEEITFAMNGGDVGRVETVFPPWIAILKACGKHKYADAMTDFLTNVHFVYPEGLRRAVRYNMLVNPTGKPGQYRGVDWVVELLNLFMKHVYGGSGSNFTKE